MRKTKWFEINDKAKMFWSIKKARTKKEMWDKTIKKWLLIWLREYKSLDSFSTCGLCNIYNKKKDFCKSKDCPIYKATGTNWCVQFSYDPELQLLFLLFVKEATE